MKTIDIYLTEKLKINKKSISSGFERSEKKKPKDGDKFFVFYASKTDRPPVFVVNQSIFKDFHIDGDTVSFKYNPFGKEVTELKNVYVNSNGYYEESTNDPGYKYVAVLMPLDKAEETVKNLKNDLLMTAESIFDEKHKWLFTDDLYLPQSTDLEKILKAILDAK